MRKRPGKSENIIRGRRSRKRLRTSIEEEAEGQQIGFSGRSRGKTGVKIRYYNIVCVFFCLLLFIFMMCGIIGIGGGSKDSI